MDAKQEVKSYIETKEIPGALLLTGEWGVRQDISYKEHS